MLISTFLCVVLALTSPAFASDYWDPVINGTELVFVFMVHRHGDRTPIEDTLKFFKNKDDKKLEDLIKPWGLGQLTDVGKRTGFKTGEFIRWRYDDIIAKRYNHTEIYIRSTDSTRCKMTALTAMSAVFSAADDPWNEFINWTPVPFTTVSVKYDFNEVFLNCPKYLKRLNDSPSAKLDIYKELFVKVSKLISYDIEFRPHEILRVHDFFESLISLGYDLGEDLIELMPQITEAAGIAQENLFANINNFSFQAGVLLNEFFNKSKAIIAGNDTQKVRIYSGHDYNVFAFEAICLASPLQGAPKFGSLFSLELRRMKDTGKYVVLPVYLTDPKNPVVKYLKIDGCGDGFLCDYNDFYALTSAFTLDEDAWREKCGFSRNRVIDTSEIN